RIDGDDLRRAPVGEPETVLVPARLLAEGDSLHQDSRFGHRRLLVRRSAVAAEDRSDWPGPASVSVRHESLARHAGDLHAGGRPSRGDTVSGLRYSDGIAAARTLLALEADASALERRLPSGWELAPYSGDDLRGTSFRGANLLIPFHEVYAVRSQDG